MPIRWKPRPRGEIIEAVNASSALARRLTRRSFRLGVVLVSVVAAIAGSVLLATRDAGEEVTKEGVTATLQVASHPGWVVAGRDAVWLAINGDQQRRVGEKPLLRLDLATGLVQRAVSVGGEASYLTRAGDRLIASVRHVGEGEFGGRILFALDWRSGSVLVQRGFNGPVDHVVAGGKNLWALETKPGTLLRLDPRTLVPTAAPLRLSADRTLDLSYGAGYLWVTAADEGELLRVDPSTRSIVRIHAGGAPVGVTVAGGSVWYADQERGDVVRRDIRDLTRGTTIHVGGKPTWLTTAGESVFVSDAENGTVTRIDARSGTRSGLPVRVAPPAEENAPLAMAPSGNAVWVSSFGSNTVTRISSPSSRAPARTILARGAEPRQGAEGALPPGGQVVATIPIASGGGAFAVGEGAVWALTFADDTLLRIDPATNSVVAHIKLQTTGEGAAAAAGAGAVWISHPTLNTVSRVDPSTNEVTATIRVGPQPAGFAVAGNAIWVANVGGPSVSRIDPATNRVVATIRVGPREACCAEHMSLAARKDAVWVAVPNANTLVRVDPAEDVVTDTVEMPYSPCAVVVADETSVWNAAGGCGDILARVDARTRKLTTTVEGEPHPIALALYDGSLWVSANHAASVDRIDPETARLTARLPIGGLPVLLGVGFGAIWVTDDEGRVVRIQPQD